MAKTPTGKVVTRSPLPVLGRSKAARQFAHRAARLTRAEITRLLVKAGPPLAKMHVGTHHATLGNGACTARPASRKVPVASTNPNISPTQLT